MTSIRRCAKCGASVPKGRVACPRCLLDLAHAWSEPESDGDPAPRRRAAPPTPEVLAADFPELEILALIGEGGMGCVYRARHKHLGRDVALKVLAPGSEDDARFEERFLREARALAKLDHPGIVRVHDFGRAGTRWYLIMEFVDGANLRELLRAGRVSPREALGIVSQLCDALQYAHDEGVVHRDIKPENVLIDAAGRVKLADFGLAKIIGATTDEAGRTQTGHVMGTLHYMAPEQSTRPREVDHRADLYSLGVVFYEMLTGELPIGNFERPSKHVRVDVRLDEIVLKSLERAPERRYQHAVDVRTDVEHVSNTDEGAAAELPRVSRTSGVRTAWQFAGWFAASIASWVCYWVFFDEWAASLAVLLVSVLGVFFVRTNVAPRLRTWRMVFAVPVHLLGSVVFIVDRIHRWETLTADYFAQLSMENWIGFGGQRARVLATEALQGGPYDAQSLRAWHQGRWPLFEYDGFLLVAIGLWFVSAAILFVRSTRLRWDELIKPALMFVGVSTLTAIFAVVRVELTRARPLELSDRAVVGGTLEDVVQGVKRFASDSGLGSLVEAQWQLRRRGDGVVVGRAALIEVETESPFRRWRFDALRGPRRIVPRVAVTAVQLDGLEGCRVEWHLGSVAIDPSSRIDEWRAIAADLLEELPPR